MLKRDNTAYSTLAYEFNLLFDEPLKNHTSFKVGGPADMLALPKDKQELKSLLKKASDLDIPVTLFGGGTNLLVTDKGIRGLVVITRQLKSEIRITQTDSDKKTICVAAGERLSKVCQFAINHCLSGLEFAAGIPGTIGGAIMMNAGTKSGDMSGIAESIDVLNKKTLIFETIEKKNLNFSYRQLNLTGIIVAARLTLKEENKKKIEETFRQNLIRKNATQPVSFASAGCFFKNPTLEKSAGELIEKAGLKGMRIKDAMVSQSHANFIVNINNARCEDILLLKRQIQKIILNKFHIKLKTEVRVEGE
ncbi:MAG: UDP-N-acetylmuramate dehydrogenase [Desulfobacula sp.]|uniref:UDP-N-acetylmuramate dehydrogenase n=1 Tax=Desulfobacula sp. TaxID=2593537 RepID=UPI0025BCD52B|nr:UDP-N-acetylmuramate dehydrogenase [Desulfobacula sp.]MCD4718259.1 UDP-N-acetylmuramate dehydrogenase [Desulfobacula sp.]